MGHSYQLGHLLSMHGDDDFFSLAGEPDHLGELGLRFSQSGSHVVTVVTFLAEVNSAAWLQRQHMAQSVRPIQGYRAPNKNLRFRQDGTRHRTRVIRNLWSRILLRAASARAHL